MMVLDQTWLHVYGFNFTALDMKESRSFGIVTRNKKLVREATKLFEADFNRQPYTPGCNRFIVSPGNARERLTKFIAAARKQLLIYDPQLCDDRVLSVIAERIKAGVDVKVIGKVEHKWDVKCQKYPGKRMHVRAIVRDGARAFVGSQSLRKLELDKRREVGIIVKDRTAARQFKALFEEDWAKTESAKKTDKEKEKTVVEKKEDKAAAAAAS
jgi:polyphosphate kinase